MVIGGRDKNGRSQKSFIYDIRSDDWEEGPSLISARYGHCSCIIQSDDGTTDVIVIIGGDTNQGITNTTEIFNIKESKWTQGPPLPFGIDDAACVSLPPTMKSVSNISCVVVGGTNLDATIRNKYNSSDVYGLNSSLTS